LSLTATDLDVTVSIAAVEAKVTKPGAATVPVEKIIWHRARNCPPAKSKSKWTTKMFASVRAGASFYKIHGLAADEISAAAQITRTDKKVTVVPEKLKSHDEENVLRISTDESRYVLNGIFISLKDHKMTMVATDGRRLALVDEELDVSEQSQGEFIVPSTSVAHELNRLLNRTRAKSNLLLPVNQPRSHLRMKKGSVSSSPSSS